MKAMKKTLSCILALTLTASMMAESLSAFAEYDNSSSIGEDFEEAAPLATKAFDLADYTNAEKHIYPVIKNVTIDKLGKFDIFSDDDTLDLSDYVVTVTYQLYKASAFDENQDPTAYAAYGDEQKWKGALSLYKQAAADATDAQKVGKFVLAKEGGAAGTNEFTKLSAINFGSDPEKNLNIVLYLPTNTYDTAFAKYADVTDFTGNTAANGTKPIVVSGYGTDENDVAITGINVTKAVVDHLTVKVPDKTFYRGQSIKEALTGTTLTFTLNSGNISSAAPMTVDFAAGTDSGSVKNGISYTIGAGAEVLDGEDSTLPDDKSEATIKFTYYKDYDYSTNPATGIKYEGSVTIPLEVDEITSLGFLSTTETKKEYKSGETFDLGKAIIVAENKSGKKTYIASYNGKYRYTEDVNIASAFAIAVEGNNKTAADTEWAKMYGNGGLNKDMLLADSAAAADAESPLKYYIDFENETAGTKTATFTYKGKSLTLGTDIVVTADTVKDVAKKFTNASATLAKANDDIKDAVKSGRIVSSKTSSDDDYYAEANLSLFFKDGETISFTPGDISYQLTYDNSGTSDWHDLATDIAKFGKITSDSAGQNEITVATTDLTNIYVWYTASDKKDAVDPYIAIPVKVAAVAYGVSTDASKAESTFFVDGDTAPNMKGITVTVTNSANSTTVIDKADLQDVIDGKVDGLTAKFYNSDDLVTAAGAAAAGTFDKVASGLVGFKKGFVCIKYQDGALVKWATLDLSSKLKADIITSVAMKSPVTNPTQYLVPDAVKTALGAASRKAINGTHAAYTQDAGDDETKPYDKDLAGTVLEFTTFNGKKETVTVKADGTFDYGSNTVANSTNATVFGTLAITKPSKLIAGENSYKITYTNAATGKTEPISYTITCVDLAPKSIAAADGTAIDKDDALIGSVDIATAAPKTEFYEADPKAANESDRTIEVAEIVTGDKNFVVTWNNGKKYKTPSQGTYVSLVEGKIDQTSVANDKTATIKYTVNKVEATTKLDIDVKASEVASVAVATASDGVHTTNIAPVFYVGDSGFAPKYKTGGTAINKTTDHLWVKATAVSGKGYDKWYDLLNEEDLAKFTIVKDIDTTEVTTSAKTLQIKLGETTVTGVTYEVLASALTLDITRPDKLYYANGETFDPKGATVTVAPKGQTGTTTTVSLADIIDGKADGFTVTPTDIKTKELTTNTVITVSYAGVSKTIIAYVKDSIVTSLTKDKEITDKYYAGKYTALAQPSFAGITVSYTPTDSSAPMQLNSVPVFNYVAAGNHRGTTANKSGILTTGYYADAYVLITYVNDDGETVDDHLFAQTGEHTITLYVQDQSVSWTVNVEKVVPTSITLGDGKDVKTANGTAVKEFKQDTTTPIYVGDDYTKIAFADNGEILVKNNDGTETVIQYDATAKKFFIDNGGTTNQYDAGTDTDVTSKFKLSCAMDKEGDEIPATLTYTDAGTSLTATVKVKIVADAADTLRWSYNGGTNDITTEGASSTYKADNEYFTLPLNATTITDIGASSKKLVVTITTKNNQTLKYDLSTAEGMAKFDVVGLDTSIKSSAFKKVTLKLKSDTTKTYDIYVSVGDASATVTANKNNDLTGKKVYPTGTDTLDFTADKLSVVSGDTKIATDITLAAALADQEHYIVSIVARNTNGTTNTTTDDTIAEIIPDLIEATPAQIKAALVANVTNEFYEVRVKYFADGIESADNYSTSIKDASAAIATFTVKDKATYIKAIEMVKAPTLTYKQGNKTAPIYQDDNFRASSVKYKVTYNNGTSETLAGNNALLNGNLKVDSTKIDWTKPGTYDVTLSVDGATLKQTITVEEVAIASLAKTLGSGDPVTTYAVGEDALDFGTLELDAKDANGATIATFSVKTELEKGDDSAVKVSGFNSSKPAVDQEITVTYAGASYKFNVNIEAITGVTSISATKAPTKTSYKPSDAPSLEGGEFDVVVTTASGSRTLKKVTADELTDVAFGTIYAGKGLINAKYQGIGSAVAIGGLIVDISENAINSVTISEAPKTTYYLGIGDVVDPDKFDTSEGKLKVTYLDAPDDEVAFSDATRVKFTRDPKADTVSTIGKGQLIKAAFAGGAGKYEIVAGYDETGRFEEGTAWTSNPLVKTVPFNIEVKNDKVTAIEVTDLQKTQYLTTDKFDATGAKVKFTLESGREANEIALTDAMFEVSEIDGSKLGKQDLTVTCTLPDETKVTTTITVEVVENLVDKIEIVKGTADLQLLYTTADEKIDLTGVQLEVTYKAELADGTKVQKIDLAEAIKSGDATIGEVDFTKTDAVQKIKVTYKGKECDLEVKVTKLNIKEIVNSTKDPIATTVKKGTTLEEFRKSGSITVNYIAGDKTKEVPLTSDKITITGFDASKEAAEQKLTITYKEADQEASFDLTIAVSDKTIVSIKAAVGKAQKEFKVGDTFTSTGATVVVTYKDGEGDPETFQLPNDLFTVTAPDMTKASSAAAVTVALKSDPTIKSTYTVKIVGEAADSEIGEEVKGVTEPTDVVNALPTDYELTKNPVALFEETVSDDTTSYKYVAGYETLDAMFAKNTVLGTAKTATGKYVILISGEQTPTTNIKLPNKATAIKFIGADENAKLNLKKLTTINVKEADIEIDVPVTANKNVAITVGKGRKLIIGEQAKGSVFGAIKGDKTTSTVDFNGDVTVASIANFASVNTAPGHKTTLAAKGSIKTVGKLSGHYVFPSDATASAISVTKAEFDIMQGTKQGKITLDNVTAEDEESVGLLVKVLDSNNELVELSNGTPILYTKENDAKFTKSITIANNDGALSAVSYKKELRAEDETLLTVGDKSYSSFEKLFSEITSGDVVIEMNASATMSKATKINKNITSITIKGGSDVVLTTEVTAIKAPKITLEDLTIKSTKALTITASGAEVNLKNVKFAVKANGMTIAGNKKATVLTIEDVTGIDKLQNFLKVQVKGQVSVTKTVAIEELALDDGTIVFGKDAGVKIGTLSGSGTIGIVAPSKKFKTITITKASGEEGDIKVAEYKLEALDDGSPIYVLVSAPTIAEGTLIFTSKDKTLDTKLFDADALGGELVNDGKGKITLKKSS